MPAKNPRLTITLEPLLAAQLRRLSELTGNSQSKLIAEILEGSTQIFDRLIRVLEAAEMAKASLKAKTVNDLAEAQTRVETQLGLVLGEFDGMTDSLLKQAEAINRRARRASPGQPQAARVGHAAGVVTPPSNRGVRSEPKQAKKLTRSRG